MGASEAANAPQLTHIPLDPTIPHATPVDSPSLGHVREPTHVSRRLPAHCAARPPPRRTRLTTFYRTTPARGT